MKDLPYDNMIANIQFELKSYLEKNKLKSLVLGISGGIDSALCAAIAKPVCDKLKIPLIGRSIPISTNTADERKRADLIGKAFCTDYDEVSVLQDPYEGLWDALQHETWDTGSTNEPIRRGNVKARMRMIYLYDLAQVHGGMVLSTDNYTEYLLGFWTLHGDVGDYGMLQNLWKTEVYDMAEHLASTLKKKKAKALTSCITCQATDGLGISKTDLDQIVPGWKGTSRVGYEDVDEKLKQHLNGKVRFPGMDPVVRRHRNTEFKRNNPFNIPRNKIL